MNKVGWFFSISIVVGLFSSSTLSAVERVKVGTAIKGNPSYYLPLLAAQEKGFWKEQGLEGEWVSFNSSVAMGQAALAGAIDLGIHQASGLILVASRGIPVIGVAKLADRVPWYLWVRKDSRIKEPADLKGARIAVTRIGDIAHAFALALAKELALEKDVKFIAVGGVPHMIAGLRTGVVDVLPLSAITMARMEHDGVARKIVDVRAHTAQSLDHLIIYARKEAVQGEPGRLKAGLRAVFKGADFVTRNPQWSAEKMRQETDWPQPVALKVHELSRYSKDGKLDLDGLERLRAFLLEYGIVARGAPAVSQLYTARFVPVE